MISTRKRLRKIELFPYMNAAFLLAITLLCILPIINIIAISLSSKTAVAAGEVAFLPKDFTLAAYEFLAKRSEFWQAMGVTLQRLLLGGGLSILITLLTAYPLSKEESAFRGRTVFAWIFFFTSLFGGGLIPSYILITELGLINSIWSLVLPAAVQVFNIVVLLNFFRQIPKSLEEAGLIDGAGHFTILFRIYVPSALPAIATITLFVVVGHWNSWFDGLLYMNFPEKYPLQTYLQRMIIAKDFSMMTGSDIVGLGEISEKTIQSAQIFVGALPVMLVYPFLQKYFVKGLVIGSVKE